MNRVRFLFTKTLRVHLSPGRNSLGKIPRRSIRTLRHTEAMSSPPPIPGPRTYEAGTLRYTLGGLAVLFGWLLWGDFAFCFFENIFGRFIPLYLREYQAPNAMIGIMMGSIAGAMNLLFLPGISRWSDECRSRWGRRIPFLTVATPLAVASLILMGFAPEIGAAAYRQVVHPLWPGVEQATVVLGLLGLFVASFHYFNMVLVNVYNWLIRDVVPSELIGRFLSWFGMVSLGSAALFNWYVFPYLLTHRREICLSIGLFYLVVFLLMCRKVKEGKYPPPPERKASGHPLRTYFIEYGRYLRTCLSVPIYRDALISHMLVSVAVCAGPFYVIFQHETLGVSMEVLGKLFSIFGVLSAALYAPSGWIIDRLSPFRVALATGPALLLVGLSAFLFNVDQRTLIFFMAIGTMVSVPATLASQTITMKLYPEGKFAQFYAAQNLLGFGIAIAGNYYIGRYLDLFHSNYRMVYLWSGFWSLLSYLMFLKVYRAWRRLGGPDNYVAPAPPG